MYTLLSSLAGIGLPLIFFPMGIIAPCSPPIISSVIPMICPTLGHVGNLSIQLRLSAGMLAGYLCNSIGALVGLVLCSVTIHPSRVELLLLGEVER